MTSALELIRNIDQNLLLILKFVLLKAKVQKRRNLPRKSIKRHSFRCLLKSRISVCFMDFLTFLWFYVIIIVQVLFYNYGSCSDALWNV